MHEVQNTFPHAVTLLGGAPVEPEDLRRAYALAPQIIAADGGARHAAPLGLPVTHILGDLDSLTNYEVWRNSGTGITRLNEQESTDFEKSLYSTEADLYLGLGFLGGRLDHSLAALRTLCVYGTKKVILLGEAEVVFHVTGSFEIRCSKDERVSLFPMAPVTGLASQGLRWPIDGLQFAPNAQIGTSNAALGGEVCVVFDGPGMLIMLDKERLEDVIHALAA